MRNACPIEFDYSVPAEIPARELGFYFGVAAEIVLVHDYFMHRCSERRGVLICTNHPGGVASDEFGHPGPVRDDEEGFSGRGIES